MGGGRGRGFGSGAGRDGCGRGSRGSRRHCWAGAGVWWDSERGVVGVCRQQGFEQDALLSRMEVLQSVTLMMASERFPEDYLFCSLLAGLCRDDPRASQRMMSESATSKTPLGQLDIYTSRYCRVMRSHLRAGQGLKERRQKEERRKKELSRSLVGLSGKARSR